MTCVGHRSELAMEPAPPLSTRTSAASPSSKALAGAQAG